MEVNSTENNTGEMEFPKEDKERVNSHFKMKRAGSYYTEIIYLETESKCLTELIRFTDNEELQRSCLRRQEEILADRERLLQLAEQENTELVMALNMAKQLRTEMMKIRMPPAARKPRAPLLLEMKCYESCEEPDYTAAAELIRRCQGEYRSTRQFAHSIGYDPGYTWRGMKTGKVSDEFIAAAVCGAAEGSGVTVADFMRVLGRRLTAGER